jgi:hypothetical protein
MAWTSASPSGQNAYGRIPGRLIWIVLDGESGKMMDTPSSAFSEKTNPENWVLIY